MESIVKASKADIPALNVLINSAYRGDSSKKGWTTEADLLDGIRVSEESLAEMFENPAISMLKYTQNEVLQACVCLEDKKDYLYLGMLTVNPEMQAGGIGKKLLFAAEEFALSKGLSKIRMTAISVREELIAYYERKGYVKTGETEPFPMDDPKFGLPKQKLEFLVLEKSLLH